MDALKVYKNLDYQFSPKILIHQPTLDEVAEYGEARYFSTVRFFCSTPADRKADIWQASQRYWDEVDEFELFLSMSGALAELDLSILFPSVDFTSFKVVINGNAELAMQNTDGVVIDRVTHLLLTEHLRFIHILDKNMVTGYDNATKDAMIEDDLFERELAANKPAESQLWPMISALTNSEGFKYRYDDVWQLPIGVFLDAAHRVQKRINYSHLMTGIYSGCVDMKQVNKKEFDWMGGL